ncbi:gamma-glutamyltransferase [Pirellulaceae bacterium SH467]
MISRRFFLGNTAAVATLAPAWSFGQEKTAPSSVLQRVDQGSNVTATVHPIASLASAEMMRRGGNAIDAAVAAAVCLSVVDGHNSGIGGGCLMMIRLADGSLHAIDGREKAPASANRDMFLRNGVADVKLSQDGPLACGVPGMIAALHSAHVRFGKLAWGDLFEPAIRAARDGHPMSRSTYGSIKNEESVLKRFAASREALFKTDGSLYAIGERWVQADLANTLQQIAKKGVDYFYHGEFASRCAEHLKEQGGALTQKDFADYRAVDRVPLKTSYRGYTVIGFPPPSSGGIHIQQMLQMLSHFPLKELSAERGSVPFYHVLAEAMKLAFADRAYYLGDSDFVEIPAFLTEPSYTDELAKKIHLDRATAVPGHLPSKSKEADDGKKHTTHMTMADASGNWVAMTATVNTGWGNKMIVPGTGVVLNDEMDDFSISPGVPNAFGLIGSAANAIEPGKRPLSSMSPTMVLDANGEPRLTCGAAGGPRIINATLQNLVRVLDLGMNVGDAIAASRLHHQWQPDVLSCEGSLGGSFQRDTRGENSILEALKKLGHDVKISGSIAVAQGIERLASAESGKPTVFGQSTWRAACDPRADGRVATA